MSAPMPVIEVGDWVRLRTTNADIVEVNGTDFDGSYPYGGGAWFFPCDAVEVRKADGRVWRRERAATAPERQNCLIAGCRYDSADTRNCIHCGAARPLKALGESPIETSRRLANEVTGAIGFADQWQPIK
jgi:hypothetical protein